ncbi:MAG: SMP-30/gluconolactonase/LRE family protein [Pseudomonadota bacterium]
MGPKIDCLVDAKAKVGEAPLWSPDEQCLWWVDIEGQLLHRTDPATGADETWAMPEPIGCVALHGQGGLVVALAHGFHRFDPRTATLTPLAEAEPDRPNNRFNDGTTDGRGRFWAGTMNRAGPQAEPEGTLYRLDAGARVTAVADGFFTPNGLAFSADDRLMYLSDSAPAVRTIWVADYDADDGVYSNRRVFFDTRAVAGRPDGGCIDVDGCYWMAGVGGWQLVRLTPRGEIDRIVDMPVERPSKIAFGGPDLRTMFVTSIGIGLTPGTEARQPQAGGLFVLELGIQGLPPVAYPG